MNTYLVKKEEIPEELPQDVKITDLMQGVKAWTNSQNGFRVLRVHYSADPKKRGDEYKAEIRKAISHTEYLREYEICWRAFEGKPVFIEDWNRNFHVAPQPLKWASHLPVIRGWDFGITPACVFAQLMPEMKLWVLQELCGDTGIESFLSTVQRKSLEWFPGAKRFIDVVDPSGFYRRDTDARSCVDIMAATPFFLRPIPGIQNPVKRRNSVVKFLERNVRGQPAFLVSPTAPMIIGGFDGGYHYPTGRNGALKEDPLKNEYSHPHDALQYITTRVFDIDLSVNVTVPTIKQPSYRMGTGA